MPALVNPRPLGFAATVQDGDAFDLACRRCGRCCYTSVIFHGPRGRANIAVRELPCRYLLPSGLCSVYPERHEIAPWCLPVKLGILASGYPADCPYVRGLPGYDAGKIFLPRDKYDLVRPSLRRELVPRGRPQMVSEAAWARFVTE